MNRRKTNDVLRLLNRNDVFDREIIRLVKKSELSIGIVMVKPGVKERYG